MAYETCLRNESCHLSDQHFQIESAMTIKIKITYGVPQGSFLRLVLFLLCMNKLNSSIERGKVHNTDDTTISIKAESNVN